MALTVRQGEKHMCCQTALHVTSNCPQVSAEVANGQRWHPEHLSGQTTGGKAPETCRPAPASFELQIQILCAYWNGM